MGILCLVFSLFFTFSEWKKLKDGHQGRYYQVKEAYQALGDSMTLSNKKYLMVHSEADKTGGTMRGVYVVFREILLIFYRCSAVSS